MLVTRTRWRSCLVLRLFLILIFCGDFSCIFDHLFSDSGIFVLWYFANWSWILNIAFLCRVWRKYGDLVNMNAHLHYFQFWFFVIYLYFQYAYFLSRICFSFWIFDEFCTSLFNWHQQPLNISGHLASWLPCPVETSLSHVFPRTRCHSHHVIQCTSIFCPAFFPWGLK